MNAKTVMNVNATENSWP